MPRRQEPHKKQKPKTRGKKVAFAGETSPRQTPLDGVAAEEIVPPLKPGITLSPPSEELAKRILTEVGWAERIEGFRYAPMVGDMREIIYSFRNATNLLVADIGNPWSRNSGFFGYFDFGELQTWVRDVFGDKELADAIGEKTKAGSSLKEQIEAIKPLMEQRLRQCEEMLGEGV